MAIKTDESGGQLLSVKQTRKENCERWGVALGEVAEIEVEEYLKGVVCGEMEGFPNSPEALKAQAIASRTYALYRAKHNENGYDLDDTTKCQVLLASRMAPAYDEAVEGTRGDILIYKGRIIDAVYSASNGGRVVSAQERWGETIPYLIAKPDPYNAQRMGLGRQGHGVGMSQWGAYQAEKAGLSCEEILAFYYVGAEIIGDYGADILKL